VNACCVDIALLIIYIALQAALKLIIIIVISNEINVTKCNMKKLIGHNKKRNTVITRRLDTSARTNNF